MKILVVDDHYKIRENIIEFLKIKWYIAEWAVHGQEALEKIHTNYDVIVLDMNMPVFNGWDFLRKIRENHNHIPILALTSNSDIDDKINTFKIGADDYMTKPFDMRELEMRILALARRREAKIEEKIMFWEYTLNLIRHALYKNDELVELTSKEYTIVEFLARHKWIPKTKQEILEAAWWLREAELNFDSITLEVHISGLRKKLGKNTISTIKWIGYFIA